MSKDQGNRGKVVFLADIHDRVLAEPERWGERPIEMDATPVRVRFEEDKLHPIWWRGRQWAVTAFGIERLDGTYRIAANRLREDLGGAGWPTHMAEKTWLDAHDFLTAWLVALAMHSSDGVRQEIMKTPIWRK